MKNNESVVELNKKNDIIENLNNKSKEINELNEKYEKENENLKSELIDVIDKNATLMENYSELKNENTTYQNEIKKEKEQNENALQEIEAVKFKYNESVDKLKEKDEEIDNFKKEYEKKCTEFEKLIEDEEKIKNELNEKNCKLEEAKTQAEENKNKINELMSQLNEKIISINDFKEQLEKKESEIEIIENQLKNNLTQHQKDIDSKDNLIKELTEKVKCNEEIKNNIIDSPKLLNLDKSQELEKLREELRKLKLNSITEKNRWEAVISQLRDELAKAREGLSIPSILLSSSPKIYHSSNSESEGSNNSLAFTSPVEFSILESKYQSVILQLKEKIEKLKNSTPTSYNVSFLYSKDYEMMKKNYDKLKEKSDKYDELIKKYNINESDLLPENNIESEESKEISEPTLKLVNLIEEDEKDKNIIIKNKDYEKSIIDINKIIEENENEKKKIKEIYQQEKENSKKVIEDIKNELLEKNELINNYQNRYKDIIDYLENTILNEIYNKNENDAYSINQLIDEYKNKISKDEKFKQESNFMDIMNIIEKSVKIFIDEKDKLKSSLEEAHKIIDLQHEKIESVNEENNNLLEIMNKEKIRKDQEKLELEYSLTPSNNDSKYSLIESLPKSSISKNIENDSSNNLIHNSSGLGLSKLNSTTFNNSIVSLDPNLKNQIDSIINSNINNSIDPVNLKSVLNSLYDKYNILEQTYHLVNQRLEYQKSANQDIKKMIVTAQIGKTFDNNIINNNEKLDKNNDELIMKKYCDILEKNNELSIELEQKQMIIDNLQETLNNNK